MPAVSRVAPKEPVGGTPDELSEPNAIIRRHPSFDFSGQRRHWNGGDPVLTTLFNGVSILLPDAEAFLIEAVKLVRHKIKATQLQKDINDFIAQESAHRSMHSRYNNYLEQFNIPAWRIAKSAKLNVPRRLFSPLQRIALTAALEHYTSLVARVVLGGSPRLLKDADPMFQRLWRWHALEELEHRAVAHDVYAAIAPRGVRGYLLRVGMMFFANVIFSGQLLINIYALLKAERLHYSVHAWSKLAWVMFFSPAVVPRLFLPYLDYFRPGFHPNDHDLSDLIAAGRAFVDRGEG